MICDDAVILQPDASALLQSQQQQQEFHQMSGTAAAAPAISAAEQTAATRLPLSVAPGSRVVAVLSGYHSDDEDMPSKVHSDLHGCAGIVRTVKSDAVWRQVDLESQQQSKQPAAAASSSSSSSAGANSSWPSLRHAASAAWLAAQRHAASAARCAAMAKDLAGVARAAAVRKVKVAQQKVQAAAHDFMLVSCPRFAVSH
jgi:hypothetical protein